MTEERCHVPSSAAVFRKTNNINKCDIEKIKFIDLWLSFNLLIFQNHDYDFTSHQSLNVIDAAGAIINFLCF